MSPEDSTPPDGGEQDPTYPTETGFYVCNVPREQVHEPAIGDVEHPYDAVARGDYGDYGYVLLVGTDEDPTGPWVKVIGSDRRVHASRCTSWTNMAPYPAGGAHRAFGRFGECKTCHGDSDRSFSSNDRYEMVDWLNAHSAAGWETSSTSMTDGRAVCRRCA